MSILKTKTPKPQVIKILADNPFAMPVGMVREVINGAVPGPLRPYCEAYDGPLPYPLLQIDAIQFVSDTRERVAPLPPALMTRDELQQQHGWPAEALERAEKYDFPRAVGYRTTAQGQRALYRADKVAQWVADIGEMARMLGIRG